MVPVQNIHSLTDFQRNAKSHIRRLKKTGQPEVLTVNGEAQVVVQDAESYQKLLDDLEQAQTVQGIARGLESASRGEGRTLAQFDARMRKKYAIPRETT